jgi:dihydrofolate synthase/folylpolyglutamate synthase
VSYPDSVRYLYSLGNELKAGAKFGLERMHTLLSALGNPEREQRFIHVAGTNGKGSTCAMISSILRSAGLRAGLYTSPHLIEPTERIQVNGRDVSAERFAAAFQAVHEVAERLAERGQIDAHPSYFETVTAMALVIFRQTTELSVMEVGLGGRLDATNVITPELCVITPVSYDHESFLGNSLESIAAEKAGILKKNIPLVLGRQEGAAEEVIVARAMELGCDITRVADGVLEAVESNPDGSSFRLDGDAYLCPLPGRHQVDNAVAAVLACRALNISADEIGRGLRETQWPGRLERIKRSPDFFLDGAHNPAGARALASYIREFCGGKPVWLVYGAMRDKAIEEVTEQLFPLASKLILTAPDFSRALRPEAILEMTSHSNAVVTAALPEAIDVAAKAPADAIVFFTGSLYLVGEARKLLLGRRPSFVE